MVYTLRDEKKRTLKESEQKNNNNDIGHSQVNKRHHHSAHYQTCERMIHADVRSQASAMNEQQAAVI